MAALVGKPDLPTFNSNVLPKSGDFWQHYDGTKYRIGALIPWAGDDNVYPVGTMMITFAPLGNRGDATSIQPLARFMEKVQKTDERGTLVVPRFVKIEDRDEWRTREPAY